MCSQLKCDLRQASFAPIPGLMVRSRSLAALYAKERPLRMWRRRVFITTLSPLASLLLVVGRASHLVAAVRLQDEDVIGPVPTTRRFNNNNKHV